MEDLPQIGEFIVNSAERDIKDFNGYSPIFTIDYFAMVRSKIEVCRELAKSTMVSKELKGITLQLYDKFKSFRAKWNALEVYLKSGAKNLDVALKDIGLKNVKTDITKGNVEGLLLNLKTVLTVARRNLPALAALGLKQTHIDEIETQFLEISLLNEKQNELMRKHNRFTDETVNRFNELWHNLRLIINVAKAIYQEVDEVKLEDYIFSQVKKRINA
jgi:hypothetical protein